MPPGEGIVVELVEETDLSGGEGAEDRPPRYRAIVNCGKPAKVMVVEIRDEDGAVLPEQAIGKVWTTGPSIMSGYFRDQEATDACLVDRSEEHTSELQALMRISYAVFCLT